MTPPLLVIYGPTASGKSALALRLARAWEGEIVCADSAQVYRGMDVGTAKATPEERALVPHHGIDLVTPAEPMNAARWTAAADAAITAIRARGRQPIVEGGTLLYLRALLDGLFEAPPPDASIRERHRARAAAEGAAALHAELGRIDPATAERVHPTDLVRISRALEVYEQTGVPVSELRRRAGTAPRYGAIRVAILPPRDDLYRRIDARAARIFPTLVEEVRALRERGYGPALGSQQALGYREAGLCLEGRLSLEEGEARLARATRRYAKRQLTWIRSLRAKGDLHVYTSGDFVDAGALSSALGAEPAAFEETRE